MFRQEERHWWYIGMRRISEALLRRYLPPCSGARRILDAGCGSGGTTRWLEQYGCVTGMDLMPEAIELAQQRGVKRLVRGSVEAIPFRSGTFDLVTSFDVLYHLAVGDDLAAMAELKRVLRPGGVLLVRVAAYDWIRGAHDAATHTRHRYTRGELVGKLRQTGFEVLRSSYANFSLFPLAPAKRLLERNAPTGPADLWQPPELLNSLLADLLSLEAGPIARRGLPVGLSVVAIARKPGR
jgi:SAM-dependent methyltransferase